MPRQRAAGSLVVGATAQQPATPPEGGRGRIGGTGIGAYPVRPPGDPAALERGTGALQDQLRLLPRAGRARRRRRAEPAALGRRARRSERRADRTGARAGARHACRSSASSRIRWPTSPCSCTRSASPATTSRARSRRPSWSATPRRARRTSTRPARSCHSASGDLRGIATRIADERVLQQSWLMPGSMTGRGAPPPAKARASHRHRDRARPGAGDRHARPHRRFRGVAHHRGRRRIARSASRRARRSR